MQHSRFWKKDIAFEFIKGLPKCFIVFKVCFSKVNRVGTNREKLGRLAWSRGGIR